MKKVIRIHQKDLEEMLGNRLKEDGFLSDSPAFKGGSYRTPEPKPATPKIKLFLSEAEINFLEDILGDVNPDNKEEENMIFSISHMLRDCLIHR